MLGRVVATRDRLGEAQSRASGHVIVLALDYSQTPLNPYPSVESKMYGFSGVMG